MAEPQPNERDREMARQIGREVAELPDRTSPDDEPDIMFVTQDEIEEIARCYLSAARAEGRREAFEECAQWHEAQLPELSGSDYGMADAQVRKDMRDTYRLHFECAAAIRALSKH